MGYKGQPQRKSQTSASMLSERVLVALLRIQNALSVFQLPFEAVPAFDSARRPVTPDRSIGALVTVHEVLI